MLILQNVESRPPVPDVYRVIDPRNVIRTALKTDSRSIARKLAAAHNERLEKYWRGLAEKGETHSQGQYKLAVDQRVFLVFTTLPIVIYRMVNYPPLLLFAPTKTVVLFEKSIRTDFSFRKF